MDFVNRLTINISKNFVRKCVLHFLFKHLKKQSQKQVDGQLSLFNEAELEADASVPEPIKKDVRGYTRGNAKTKREELEYIPARLQIVRYIRTSDSMEDLPFKQCSGKCNPSIYRRKKKLAVCWYSKRSLCISYSISKPLRQMVYIYTYLEYLLLYMPDVDWCNNPAQLDLFTKNLQTDLLNFHQFEGSHLIIIFS